MDRRLSTALERNHLAYSTRTTPRGVGYAGFRFVREPWRGESSLTALLDEDVLRLTVHDVQRPADLAAVTAATATLPLGNAYVAPEDGRVEISLGVHVGVAEDLAGLLRALLDYVDDARVHLEGRAPPPVAPRSYDAGHRGSDVATALLSRGHRATPIDRGALAESRLDDGRACALQLIEANGWFIASARSLPAPTVTTAADLAVLQRLQRWTTAGRFLRAPSGELSVEVHTPILPQPRHEMILWTDSQATFMLRTAARHLAQAQARP